MARLDACHEQVANALRNDGWNVDKTPFGVSTIQRRALIDIRAIRGTNGHTEQILLVEVKCFAQPKSWTNELYTAIGQYLVYRAMLQDVNIIIPLRTFA